VFVIRSDVPGIYGSGIRAGLPHSFYFNSATKLMTWYYIWKDKVTRECSGNADRELHAAGAQTVYIHIYLGV
jgi:hypothetical protein